MTTAPGSDCSSPKPSAGRPPAWQPAPGDAVIALLSPQAESVFPPDVLRATAALCAATPRLTLAEFAAAPELSTARIMVTTWDVPRLTADWLAKLPRLEIVFYAAGSVRPFMTPEAWSRGIRVVSAADANATAVADYTVAQIVMALKGGWLHALRFREQRSQARNGTWLRGVYRAEVGLISAGAIGKQVARLLTAKGMSVYVFDPFLSEAAARELGVTRLPLDELFRHCSVVSCHAPLLPETRGLIRAEHFRRMPRGASFINTARGAVVNQDDLINVWRERPDLCAYLDVTDPEPLPADSPLFGLPNVFVTPHIAGAFGSDCARLGETVMAELRRYLAGESLRNEISSSTAANLA